MKIARYIVLFLCLTSLGACFKTLHVKGELDAETEASEVVKPLED